MGARDIYLFPIIIQFIRYHNLFGSHFIIFKFSEYLESIKTAIIASTCKRKSNILYKYVYLIKFCHFYDAFSYNKILAYDVDAF